MRNYLASLKRLVLGSQLPVDVVARGSAIGLFVSFTPTIGIQIPALILLRAISGRVWPFHLPLAIAWTMVTNVVTAPFIYYVFLVTGRVMLGRFDKLKGFEVFDGRLSNTITTDGPWWQSMLQTALGVVQEFGLPLLVGSLPWALLLAVAGYYATRAWLHRHRRLNRAG